ncbi:hypothetical protein [Pseudothioclava arenosa]|uniref:Uncharacterized protein n=1 Tax=Pseudothioclava arenosa TaxID=1795308 RepID=A0A2A4CR49_9RHOB|nr:hypothetical protein [Pseudothioclava arenosa]PCD76768.1 hypothetical protein CLN94_06585 [Pseudothioclava arenosa]
MTIQTFDLTPSWKATADLLFTLAKDGTPEGQRQARQELIRMGELLDTLIAERQSEPESSYDDWQVCDTVDEAFRRSCLSTGVPEGYETVIGYYARHNPWALAMQLDDPEATLRDGFWCKHRANERGIAVVKVPAPEIFRSQGIEQVNAYPLSLLRERMEG